MCANLASKHARMDRAVFAQAAKRRRRLSCPTAARLEHFSYVCWWEQTGPYSCGAVMTENDPW